MWHDVFAQYFSDTLRSIFDSRQMHVYLLPACKCLLDISINIKCVVNFTLLEPSYAVMKTIITFLSNFQGKK